MTYPTVTINGIEYDAEAVGQLMDYELREQLHSKGYETEQKFLDAYLVAHEAKYGEPFVVN